MLALGLHYSVFVQEETSLMQNSMNSIKVDVEFCSVGNTSSIPQGEGGVQSLGGETGGKETTGET